MNYIAIMTSVAILLHFVEGMFPMPVAIPGIKLGLANVVSLIALYLFGPAQAFTIMLLRVLMSSFLYSGFSSALFSLSGGVLSLFSMLLIWRLREKGFSIVGASVCGGIFHNIGQLAAAAIVLRTSTVFSYRPVLLISGLVTGTATGILARILVPKLDRIYQQIK
ncbi:MAG: Gx transporter family protein [Clostridiaceae bacterium]|nr:Gx transporter family protein [Clostridiaceae bacterium]